MKELIKKVTINGEEQMGVNARDRRTAYHRYIIIEE
jgi:hypothetical protein